MTALKILKLCQAQAEVRVIFFTKVYLAGLFQIMIPCVLG